MTRREKRQGLFNGELWIDAATYLRVQESGSLVKNPSIFLKKIEFVRKYEIRDGISVPRQVQSVVDTRLVGKAELTIALQQFFARRAKACSPRRMPTANSGESAWRGRITGDDMRTLFLNPPSFEGFDGGASSRWPASREIESYWYPVWLCYPAGMLPDSKVVDAPPHKVSIEQTVDMAQGFRTAGAVHLDARLSRGREDRRDDEGRQSRS